MIPISNFYTGQNAGVVIPDTPKIDKSIKNYYDKQFEISKMELEDAHRRQKQFLDFTDVTPVESIAEFNRTRQVAALDAFENKAKDLAAKYPKGLPTPALMELQSERRKLEGLQRDIKANESLYFQDLQRRNQSPDKFDIDTFQEAERILQTTGKWVGGLVPAPKDLDEIAFTTISKEMGDLPLKEKLYARKEGETVITSADQDWVVDPVLVKQTYQNKILGNSGAMLSAIREFSALPPEKQKEWFDAADTNNNGVDAKEKQNAILEYSYQDRVDRGLFNTKKKIGEGVKPATVDTGAYIVVNNGMGIGSKNKGTALTVQESLKSNQVGTGRGVKFNQDLAPMIPVPAENLVFSDKSIAFPKGAVVYVKPSMILNGIVELTVDQARNKKVEVTTTEAVPMQYVNSVVDEKLDSEGNVISSTYVMPIPSGLTAITNIDEIKGDLDTEYDKQFIPWYDGLFPKQKVNPSTVTNVGGLFKK